VTLAPNPRRLACALVLAAGACLGQSFTAEEVRGLTEDSSLLRGVVTVVTFLSARCPVSNAYGARLEAVYRDYAPKGVRFLFVNSNANESESEMSENAKAHRFTFPIYQDQSSRAAEQFHAHFTPETFVLDRNGVIQYHGAVDDAQNPARVKRQSLREALDAVLGGTQVSVRETKAFGCTIKRPRKTS
jgi:peroxiredoxin